MLRHPRSALTRCLLAAALFTVPTFSAEPEKPVYETRKLSDTLYEFRAMDSGYIVKVLASIGPDGVLLVETGERQNVPDLLRAIKVLGGGTPRLVINSHGHVEHWEGNIALGKGPIYIGHPELRRTMREEFFAFMDLDEAILPQVTVEDTMSLHFNGEEIRIKAFPGAHDNSDLVVWFTRSRAAFVGALVTAKKFTTVDEIGGDMRRYPEVTRKVLDYLPANVTIIPGHGENATHAQGEAFLQMLIQTFAKVKEGIAQKMSLDDMIKQDLLKDWRDWETPYAGRPAWLWMLHRAFTGVSEARRSRTSIFKPLHKALKERGPDGVAPAYQALKRDTAIAYRLEDRPLYRIATTLVEEKRYRDALPFAELLIQEFPASPFVPGIQALMGASHRTLGETAKALACYRKALALNPKDAVAAKAIRELEGTVK